MIHADDLILISVDDHVIESPDLFAGRLPAKCAADAPRIERRADGADVWTFRDVEIPNVALNAVAGRPKEEYGLEPQSLDEVRPGCYNAAERVKDMDAGGARVDELPVVPGLRGEALCRRGGRVRARPGSCLQRLAHRRMVR